MLILTLTDVVVKFKNIGTINVSKSFKIRLIMRCSYRLVYKSLDCRIICFCIYYVGTLTLQKLHLLSGI